MVSEMTRKIFLFVCLSALCGAATAAGKTYKYKCPKCGLIQEYAQPGTKKCPNDGRIMIRQN